jgi:membrane protease YdiL (CAAX protease family)
VRERRALAVLLVALAFATASLLAAWSGSSGDPVLALSAAAAGVELLLLALAVAAALFASGAPHERLGLVRPRLRAREIAALAVGTLGLSHALDALLALSGLYAESALAGFARSVHGARGLPLLAALLSIGLLPALAEELLCRGLLQRSLLPRLGAAPAILISALAFGALHVEPIHASFAVLLGAYLGLAGHWSGSVLAPLACHAANNLAALGVAVRSGPSLSGSPGDLALGLLLAAAALGWVLRRRQAGLQPGASSDDG